MSLKKILLISTILLMSNKNNLYSQEKHYYQTDFTISEFEARRSKIFKEIGNNSIALIQGGASVAGFKVFRQTNTFYYLSGIEEGHVYLLLNGENKKTTIYLPRREVNREKSQGKILSFDDADLIKKLTGINNVRSLDHLGNDLVRTGLINGPNPTLYTPFSPAEMGNDSRDEILFGHARAAADPWDSNTTRESRFIRLIKERFPEFKIKDLSPLLDSMRLIKSPKEIEVITKATEIAGLGIIEAMRSTKPGVYEYQLDAAAKYVFYQHGSQGDGYPAIIGGGSNAYMGHYFRKKDVLKSGDLVLMDYAPDFRNYTSDVTRIWPVNGVFNKEQTELYNFIVAYRDALFKYIKPGINSNEVLSKAAKEMKEYLVGKTFSKAIHLKAVQKALLFKGHFQHPVGMAVHDVGRVHGINLKEGMVFTIDPMIWIPEEKLYIRIEDVAAVTENGVKNLSDFVPSRVKEIEKTIKEKGLTEFRPSKSLPLKN
jgi:Xaa-Pro aminopeptidase